MLHIYSARFSHICIKPRKWAGLKLFLEVLSAGYVCLKLNLLPISYVYRFRLAKHAVRWVHLYTFVRLIFFMHKKQQVQPIAVGILQGLFHQHILAIMFISYAKDLYVYFSRFDLFLMDQLTLFFNLVLSSIWEADYRLNINKGLS